MRIRPRSPYEGLSSPRRQPPLDTLAAQFAPQHRHAKQCATEQGNCRAAIGNARWVNADVVEEEEASSAKLYWRRGARGGET